MAARRANGEGTIYKRRDGRYEGAAFFITTSGQRRRARVYGRTRAEVHDKLIELQAAAQHGVPLPDRSVRLDAYLDYWLENFVRPNLRPKTHETYETTVRLYLKPNLGRQPVIRLTVPIVQSVLNRMLDEGHSIRRVQIVRTCLSAALTRALREELVTRNVARLVELPTWERKEIQPWSGAEAKQFLEAARGHRLSTVFLLLVVYGLRRGEVLGLRWRDIDFDAGTIYIRNQLQRIGHSLQQGPVKTRAGQRTLPLLNLTRTALLDQYQQLEAAQSREPSAAHDLVFTTTTGTPIEPQNFVRSFWQLCDRGQIRVIRVHDIRHTTATLLKDLGVPARDAQLILGHASILTTQQLYQHDDLTTRRQALERVERLFWRTAASIDRCRQQLPSNTDIVTQLNSFLSGGPGGTRTLDILLKRSPQTGGGSRFQEVRRTMRDRQTIWLLGTAAVSATVKPDFHPLTT